MTDQEERDYQDLWRRYMSVDITNLLGTDSVAVFGPPSYGAMGKFPLREYACAREGDSHAVVYYQYRPGETERPTGPGTPVRSGFPTADDAYRTAYVTATEFAHEFARGLDLPVRDTCKRKP